MHGVPPHTGCPAQTHHPACASLTAALTPHTLPSKRPERVGAAAQTQLGRHVLHLRLHALRGSMREAPSAPQGFANRTVHLSVVGAAQAALPEAALTAKPGHPARCMQSQGSAPSRGQALEACYYACAVHTATLAPMRARNVSCQGSCQTQILWQHTRTLPHIHIK